MPYHLCTLEAMGTVHVFPVCARCLLTPIGGVSTNIDAIFGEVLWNLNTVISEKVS